MEPDAAAAERWARADHVATSRASGRVAVIQTARPGQAPAILADGAEALWDALEDAEKLTLDQLVARASILTGEAADLLRQLETLGLVVRRQA